MACTLLQHSIYSVSEAIPLIMFRTFECQCHEFISIILNSEDAVCELYEKTKNSEDALRELC
jgi:hypothetical protein